jgi:E3 ubiquitin-protein ligase UBR2
MHNSFAAYYPSPYVDAYGEEDVGLRRARPLTLDSSRYRALQQLWAGHDVVREIVRIRLAAERYIRQNWY